MSSPGTVTELVQRWRELRALGPAPSARELCAACPEHEAEVALRIQILEALRHNEDPTPAASTAVEEGAPEAVEDWPRIPGYEILAVLGKGGMGIVYKALHLPLKRTVALKMILAGERASPQNLARLRREAEAIALLHHPNIVAIYDLDEHEGRPYFTMEFVAGGDLKSRLDGTPWPMEAAVGLIERVARAVDAAHGRGIVHRDLKPGNVLLTPDAVPKVADFGLAKYLGGEVTQTRTGILLGTPGYMAPEQAAGQNDRVTPATDVWALGVLLFELLIGQRPFTGSSWQDVTGKILHSPPPRPRTLRPDLDPALEAILLKCLEKKPERRFATAGELADELARWRRGEPTRTYPLGWRAAGRRFLRRHALACAALAFLALTVAVVLLLFRHFDENEELRAIERDLAAGRSVTLIGPTGGPRWHVIREGGSASQVSAWPDQPCTVYTGKACLVELVRDPKSRRFRFQAQVKHLEAFPSSEAGIFVGHETRVTSRGTLHSILKMAYGDAAAGARAAKEGNPIRVQRHLYAEKRDDIFTGENLSPLAQMRFQPPEAGKTDWHVLQLDVTLESTRALWDGKVIGEFRTDRLVHQARVALEARRQRFPDDPFRNDWFADFDPRAPLGIYVVKGTAAFQNVVLEPLPEDANAP
jgi:serine/threonine-protein kinase